MTTIINLTQHATTTEQFEAGVVPCNDQEELKRLLTFNGVPSRTTLQQRAESVAKMAQAYTRAMIGGAPFFMATLEKELIRRGIAPMYAFSMRETAEEVQADGSMKKTSVFKHKGWVKACEVVPFTDPMWQPLVLQIDASQINQQAHKIMDAEEGKGVLIQDTMDVLKIDLRSAWRFVTEVQAHGWRNI